VTSRAPHRIAFISGPLGLGGAERQLLYILEGLNRTTWSPLVLHVSDTPEAHWVGPINDLDVPVVHIEKTGGRLARVRRISRVLRDRRIEIVNSLLLYLNPYAALAGTLASVPVRIGSICENAPATPRLNSLIWLGYYGLDVLITNWQGALDNIPAFVRRRAAVAVVRYGIPETALATEPERVQLKARLGCQPGHRVIGAVGRIDDNKNFDMLVRTFATLAPKWPDLQLAIIGDGPARSRLVATVARLKLSDRVALPGAIVGASALFAAFDVACLTSRQEGFPNVLMEAAMAGVPVVATRCGGTPEVVEPGVTGFLVPSEDTSDMAEKIDHFLSDPDRARACGQAARARMLREFSLPKMVTATASVYEQALGRAGASRQ
jgi:glycosyltransferase involved in cell wall biosynthesis